MTTYTKINEEKLKELHGDGMSDYEIAKELREFQGISISQSGVTRARQRLNLKPNFDCSANKNMDEGLTPRQRYERSMRTAKLWAENNKDRIAEWRKKWNEKHRERLQKIRNFKRELKDLYSKTQWSKNGKIVTKPLINRLWDTTKLAVKRIIAEPVKRMINKIKDKLSRLMIWKNRREE